ncbi:MAG: hypothetical protein M3463_03380 [Verrucomicrobiota bacterium]|nr:hypothetical protein [Verrucomicrobiota bacterium]
MKTSHYLVALSVLAAYSLSAVAQESPETVAKKQMDAMRSGDWKTFTACMHPKALAEFKASFLPLIEAAPKGKTWEEILNTLLGGKSAAVLKKMTPPAFFENFMQSFSTMNPIIKQGLAGAETEVIGHVDEGAEKTHVVFRLTVSMGEMKTTKMDVASLEKDGAEWKAVLKGDMQAMIAGLLKTAASQ